MSRFRNKRILSLNMPGARMLNTSQSYPATSRPILEDSNIYEAARYYDSGAAKSKDLNIDGLKTTGGYVNDVANRMAGWATGRGVRGRASQGLEG